MTSIQIIINQLIIFSFILLTFFSSLNFSQECNKCACMSTNTSTSVECANNSLPITSVTGPDNVTKTTIINNPLSKDNKDVINPTNIFNRSASADLSDQLLVTEVSNDKVESELINLSLSRRNLTSLMGLFRTYLHLTKVQLLNLSANHLEVLVDSGFDGLTSLKCLDLAENNVSFIQDNAFKGLISLQHLNLSRNNLKSLKDETFQGLSSLQQLDLSFNELSTIAPGSLELSSLTRLVLAGNIQLGNGNGESPLFLATGKRLQTMDASKISLGQVPSALTHSIRILHLAENFIKILSRGDIDSYPLLQLLDLASNDLLEIEEDALGRLEMLTILYLTNNHLISIPHSLPERLKILHLEHNNIDVLRPMDLDGLDQLEVLLLNGNRIKQVADGAFSQMASLVSLDLSANPLRDLPAGILAGPLGLRVLRLGQLNVSMPTVKETVFPLPSTEHLIMLDVSGSPAVARQWLADTAALAAARELQELDLSACMIEYLPMDMLHYLPQLRSLHLRENILNCSGLEWLAEWMRRQEVEEYREVFCQSPGELWGTLLLDLQSLQETNIVEKTTYPYFVKTTVRTTSSPLVLQTNKTDKSGELSGIVEDNPYAMNILREDVKVTTPAADRDANGKKANRILKAASGLGEQNTTIRPKAIKTVTSTTSIPITSQTTNSIRSTSESSTTRRSNLFMKYSSSRKPSSEYFQKDNLQGHVQHEKLHIKSLSLVENHQRVENNTTSNKGEASMYTTMIDNEHQQHPGMYLLIIGIMGATLVLITLTSRMSRRTRNDLQELRAYQQYQGDLIEVNSLPSVTELW